LLAPFVFFDVRDSLFSRQEVQALRDEFARIASSEDEEDGAACLPDERSLIGCCLHMLYPLWSLISVRTVSFQSFFECD
jgi:hypothetical protein